MHIEVRVENYRELIVLSQKTQLFIEPESLVNGEAKLWFQLMASSYSTFFYAPIPVGDIPSVKEAYGAVEASYEVFK